MATHIKNDFAILAEEKFDFDLSLSPASENGDVDEEDEVFVGPVGHREKCISVGIESHLTEGSRGGSGGGGSGGGPFLGLELGSWSPLTGDKFEQIIQEAHLLARRIGTGAGDEPAAGGAAGSRSGSSAVAAAGPASPAETTEPFAEDPAAKLSALERPPGPALSPIKRETFCVQESPLKQLPPAIQQRLLKAGGLNNPDATRATGRGCSPVRAPQTKAALRGKVGLSCGRGLLPSRPAVPGAYQRSKTKLPPPDMTRLLPPDKGGPGQKRSPLRRPLSSAGSSEDLLSDISVDSLNTSLPERSGLPGPRKPPGMKPLPGLRTAERRKNTSSSSSSVSSVNSSMSMSPAGKGAFNTSVSSGVSSGKLKGPGGLSRLAGSGAAAAASSKPRVSSVGTRAAAEAARAGKPTPSAQVKRAAEPQVGPAKPNPAAKKRDPAPLNLTPPAKRPIQRAGSVPNVAAATAKGANPKPKSFVTPTLTTQVKGPRRSEVPSPDSSKMIKPKKLLSTSSTESVLQKAGVPAPESLQTPTVGRKSVSALPRRSSALPTPVNRRATGIPAMTPKSARPGQAGERTGLPGSALKISQGSPVQLKVVQRPSGLAPEPVPREDGPRRAAVPPGSLAFSLEDELGEAPTAVPAPSAPEPASHGTAARPAGHGPRDGDDPDRGAENRDAHESNRGSRKTHEFSLQSQETSESSLQVQETPESSLKVQETPESSLQVQETSESSLQSQETPESSLQVQETSESSLQSQETSESSLQSQETPESSLQSQETPESSLQSQETPESSIDDQKTPESSTESQSASKSCTENQSTPESNKENTNSSTQQVQRTQNDAVKTPENKEVLLVDAPAPVPKQEEKLLIDLANTPDLIKTAPLKPNGGQLIDLSSPLITWSPVDKKENAVDSPPLINLSF